MRCQINTCDQRTEKSSAQGKRRQMLGFFPPGNETLKFANTNDGKKNDFNTSDQAIEKHMSAVIIKIEAFQKEMLFSLSRTIFNFRWR